uniref:Uncharacterized protein n=1 Tax=viral metagenome TaxID=1070528 RepID=A0A6M3X8I4_9ZZZZ
MALGVITEVGQQGMQGTSRVTGHSRVSVPLDGAYPTGGYLTISTLIKAVIGRGCTIMMILPATKPGGYPAEWARATDALKFFQYPTAQGPTTELPNLSAVLVGLSIELDVLWV